MFHRRLGGLPGAFEGASGDFRELTEAFQEVPGGFIGSSRNFRGSTRVLGAVH